MGRVWAIVVAAGSGSRFGGSKQDALLGDKPVVAWSVEAARAACDGVVLVVPAGASGGVEGGATRSESVRRGLAAVPDDVEVIVVHDAVRPLAGPALFAAAIDAVRAGADAAVCAVPVTDTIRGLHGAIERDGLVAVQTPQAFRASALRAAHAAGDSATDDATLVERAGGVVVTVPGDPRNIKITHAHDLAVAAALAGCDP
ncbi:MAG: IspD/TarI family cytidylyltransferase [Acidimicrobiales bacterium]